MSVNDLMDDSLDPQAPVADPEPALPVPEADPEPTPPPPRPRHAPLAEWASPANGRYPVNHRISDPMTEGPLKVAMIAFEEVVTGLLWLRDVAEVEGVVDEVLLQRLSDARLGSAKRTGLLFVHDAIFSLYDSGKNEAPAPGAPYRAPVVSADKSYNAQRALNDAWYAVRDLFLSCRKMKRQGWIVSDDYRRLGLTEFKYSDLYRGGVYVLHALQLVSGLLGLQGEYDKAGQVDPITGELWREAEYEDVFVFDDPSVHSTADRGLAIGAYEDDIPR